MSSEQNKYDCELLGHEHEILAENKCRTHYVFVCIICGDSYEKKKEE